MGQPCGLMHKKCPASRSRRGSLCVKDQAAANGPKAIWSGMVNVGLTCGETEGVLAVALTWASSRSCDPTPLLRSFAMAS